MNNQAKEWNTKNKMRLKYFILFLGIEKIIQHALSAVFFIYSLDGMRIPDIGTLISVSNSVMAILNAALALLFVLAFIGFVKKQRTGLYLFAVLAVFDIVAEFVFHGIGFITVSVIVAALIIISIILYGGRTNAEIAKGNFV